MKYALLALGFLALMPAASATVVTYSTSGEICLGGSGCGDSLILFDQGDGNILTIAFLGLGSTSVDPGGPGNFTFSSLGTVDVSCAGTCSAQSLDGYSLFITITQTAPTGGVEAMVGGVLSGSISSDTSSAQVTWTIPNDVTIPDFRYSIQNNPLSLVSPASNNGETTVQGRIDELDDLAIPEPSTYLLLSAGLLGIGLRRKFFTRG